MRIDVSYNRILVFLLLFVPMGFTMDFVHEFGHGIWGIATGGVLTYMKITWFEIYPKPALTSTFALGYVTVSGLKSEFAYGLMSLDGSLTTNIVAWVIALIMLIIEFGANPQTALKTLGLFGVLDLPLYVVLPQIGLQHWIFIGGSEPEPLLGARHMGIPDPAFYLIVTLTTIGLVFLYLKPFWLHVAKLKLNR